MDMLDPIRTGQVSPSVYRLLSPPPVDQVLTTVTAWGWRAFHLDGRNIIDKPSFLAAVGTAMEFPAYYGQNWDALNDMLWRPVLGPVAGVCAALHRRLSLCRQPARRLAYRPGDSTRRHRGVAS